MNGRVFYGGDQIPPMDFLYSTDADVRAIHQFIELDLDGVGHLTGPNAFNVLSALDVHDITPIFGLVRLPLLTRASSVEVTSQDVVLHFLAHGKSEFNYSSLQEFPNPF
jgi:hypothetical protein